MVVMMMMMMMLHVVVEESPSLSLLYPSKLCHDLPSSPLQRVDDNNKWGQRVLIVVWDQNNYFGCWDENVGNEIWS